MQILKDTISTVSSLIAKVKKVAKTATAENKVLWKEFLKECRTFIRLEKKRLAQKWNALRFASESAAQLHDGLINSKDKDMKEVFRTLMFENLEGYFLWVEKTFRKQEYKSWGDNYNNFYGSLYQAAIETNDIPKIARWYAKTFFKQFKFSIKKAHYGTFYLTYDQSVQGAKEAAKKIEAFTQAFNHDRGDSYSDYFDTRFYFFVRNQNGTLC